MIPLSLALGVGLFICLRHAFTHGRRGRRWAGYWQLPQTDKRSLSAGLRARFFQPGLSGRSGRGASRTLQIRIRIRSLQLRMSPHSVGFVNWTRWRRGRLAQGISSWCTSTVTLIWVGASGTPRPAARWSFGDSLGR